MSAADAQHEQALRVLAEYRDRIRGGAERQAAVTFVPATWRRYVQEAASGGNARAVIADFEAVLAVLDSNSVNRAQLRDFAQRCQPADTSGLRQLFIATMIWGRGKKNGRMMPGLARAIHHPALPQLLYATSKAESSAAAYRSWKSGRLPGLEEAFFTKWLWAASMIETCEYQAFVLDSQVRKSLTNSINKGGLAWYCKTAAGTRRLDSRYQAYVDACVEWAASLDCSAADIEWALFEADGDLRGLLS